MVEDNERKARMIRFKILRLQKELAATQQHARLGSFLHTNRPETMRSQGERDRKRIEEEIVQLREQLETLTAPSEAAAKKLSEKETSISKKKATAPKTPTKKKKAAAPKKKATVKKSKSAKKARQPK